MKLYQRATVKAANQKKNNRFCMKQFILWHDERPYVPIIERLLVIVVHKWCMRYIIHLSLTSFSSNSTLYPYVTSPLNARHSRLLTTISFTCSTRRCLESCKPCTPCISTIQDILLPRMRRFRRPCLLCLQWMNSSCCLYLDIFCCNVEDEEGKEEEVRRRYVGYQC